MDNMEKIRQKVQAEKPDSGARQIGEVVLLIAAASGQAAEIIAADLDNESMSLAKCFDALRDYARKHQNGGFWGCMCNKFEQGNPVIQVVCEFYKVPAEAFADMDAEEQKPKRLGIAAAEGAGGIDLLDLL